LTSTTPVTVNLLSDTATATHTNRTVKTGAAGQAANFENVTGGAGNDKIGRAAGRDRLVGNAGNDSLVGSSGNDTLVGGEGNDTYSFAAATASQTDTIIEDTNQRTDILYFSPLTSATPVTVNLLSDTATATHTNRTVKTGAAGQAANFENVTGGAGND